MTAMQIVGLPDAYYNDVRRRYGGKKAAFAAVPVGTAFRVGVLDTETANIELIPTDYGEFKDATKAWDRADRLNLFTFGLSQRKSAKIIAPMMRRQPDLFGFKTSEAPH